ncbi:MAG: two-component sensor histidine kinase [Proteobacteria bacterium]|nr:MAG: two-component sensor histidine kinase [Pseudomonadota bacterium]
MRRSIGLPLTIGIVLVVLALALAVGWNVLVVRGVGEVREVAESLSGTHWLLLSLGTLFYALLIAGLALLCAWLVREMRHSQRQQAFLDAVTHEMKTPLASLRLYLDTFARGDPGEQHRRDFLGRMRSDVDRLERTVDQVLAAARAARARPAQPDRIALRDLLGALIGEARDQYGLAEEALRLHVDGDLAVLGDREELSLVFRNLIDNAVKYSGANVDVRVRAAGEGESGVRIDIEDRGVGIPREELRRIFQPFYRAGANVQRRVKGLGLGLFIVRFLVRRQGGRVEARSEGPGRGARFAVWLRAAPAAVPARRGAATVAAR